MSFDFFFLMSFDLHHFDELAGAWKKIISFQVYSFMNNIELHHQISF